MKKYLISTLTAAAAMAVPAFADATLLGSWDFSQVTGTTGSIASTTGSLTLTTGSSVSEGNLVITRDTSSSGNDHETTIALSDQNISVTEGISVVITLEGWSFLNGNNILASLSSSGETDYVAAGVAANGAFSGDGSASIWGAASGSDTRFGTTSGSLSFAEGTATTIILTFIGDTVSYYQDGVLIGTGTINSSYYDSTATIGDVAIGSWDRNSTNSEPSSLTISSLEIWRGDVTTLPEPELFSIFFGLGAIGLVATRRRRR